LPFSERWKLLDDEIIRPRYHDKGRSPSYKYDMELFSVPTWNMEVWTYLFFHTMLVH
jgi:hypothetical protein